MIPRRILAVLALAATFFVPSSVPVSAVSVAPTIVVTIGTSIPAGVGVGTDASWPERLEDRTGLPVVDRSLGGGAYMANNSAGDNIRKHVDAAIAEFADVENKTMILDGPVNDLVILDYSQIGNLNWAVHNADVAATNAGWHVIGQAIQPFTDCSGCAFPVGWWPTLEQRRQGYNQWGAAHFGGRWTDPSQWMKETSSTRGDARWFTDGLHPRAIAHSVIAESIPPALLEVP